MIFNSLILDTARGNDESSSTESGNVDLFMTVSLKEMHKLFFIIIFLYLFLIVPKGQTTISYISFNISEVVKLFIFIKY